MHNQLQQAIRTGKCKACDEGHAYYKAYGMPLHKQYGMHQLRETKPFLDIKFLEVGVNKCLSISSDQKTDHGHAISY